jgi:hypothetical protein
VFAFRVRARFGRVISAASFRARVSGTISGAHFGRDRGSLVCFQGWEIARTRTYDFNLARAICVFRGQF